jgi:hypothetical protein
MGILHSGDFYACMIEEKANSIGSQTIRNTFSFQSMNRQTPLLSQKRSVSLMTCLSSLGSLHVRRELDGTQALSQPDTMAFRHCLAFAKTMTEAWSPSLHFQEMLRRPSSALITHELLCLR